MLAHARLLLKSPAACHTGRASAHMQNSACTGLNYILSPKALETSTSLSIAPDTLYHVFHSWSTSVQQLLVKVFPHRGEGGGNTPLCLQQILQGYIGISQCQRASITTASVRQLRQVTALISLDHKKKRQKKSQQLIRSGTRGQFDFSPPKALFQGLFIKKAPCLYISLEPLARTAFMLMYHDNLFLFLLANEGWRCINQSFWDHWLTGQGIWHMLYIALSSGSEACRVILVWHWAPSHSSPLSLLTLLWVGRWTPVQIRINFFRASETTFMNAKAT